MVPVEVVVVSGVWAQQAWPWQGLASVAVVALSWSWLCPAGSFAATPVVVLVLPLEVWSKGWVEGTSTSVKSFLLA